MPGRKAPTGIAVCCPEIDLIGGKVMILHDGNDFIELKMAERTPAGLPSAGDVRFNARVQFSTFSAESDVWVDAPALRSFVEQLREVERTRQGGAILVSMSPGELRLEIRATDSLGHVGAVGELGRWCRGTLDGRFWSSVAFGIPFDPSLLAGLLEEFELLD
jgi:hypothetical protein